MVTVWSLCRMPVLRRSCRPGSYGRRWMATSRVWVSEDGKRLQLKCGDEEERRYHGVWLRHNCRCRECLGQESDQNIVHHSHLVDVTITNASIRNGDSVEVHWDGSTGSHSCTFSVDWLKKYDYTTDGVHENRRRSQEPVVTEHLPQVSYDDMSSSDAGIYKWLKQLNHYGMSLITDIPHGKDIVEICSVVGDPQPHAYLSVFDVVASPDIPPVDAAYSTDDLIIHSDQNYLESPPGIQILHCLKFDECVDGGLTMLVDAYNELNILRRDHPQHFKALASIPYSMHRIHDNTSELKLSNNWRLSYTRPHVSLDRHGRIVGFSWSPQFHSPLMVNEDEVDKYYQAFIHLSKMLEEPSIKITHRLLPGQAVTFNNRRVLHKRTAFQLNGGQRHLRGMYLNIDFFQSAYEVYANRLNTGECSKHVFNQSW